MDKIKLKGTGRAILRYDDGRVETIEQPNMIVTSGFNFLISSLIKSGADRPNPMSHVAIGSGSTASTASMTALVTETNRGAGTWSWTAGNKKFTIRTTFPKGSVTALITEGGVFNAASGGTMLDRLVFSTPIQGSADLTYTQEFEFEVL